MEIETAWRNLSQSIHQAPFTAATVSNVKTLTFRSCTLDPIIFNAVNVSTLQLYSCTLVPSMWKLAAFPSLKKLTLTTCTCNNWPAFFASLNTSLTILTLNPINGTLPLDWSRFTMLAEVYIEKMKIQNQFVRMIFPPSITQLWLISCDLNATSLPNIATLTTLKTLDLSTNNMALRVPTLACLSSLTNLATLKLNRCSLNEAAGISLARALSCMPNLIWLEIANNIGLRQIGLNFILNALLPNKDLCFVDIEDKFFEHDRRLRVNYKGWTKLNPFTLEWLQMHCTSTPNYTQKCAGQIECCECLTAREKHEKTCKCCREREPCEDHDKMKCSHNTSCFVCMDTLTTDSSVVELVCHHFFCNRCIMNWIVKTPSCPICRARITTDDE